MKWLFDTNASWRSLVQRLALAAVMLPHGLQKLGLLGGGGGFAKSAEGLAHTAHLPVVFGGLAVLAETAGVVLLVLGLLTRVAALGLAVNMVVAVVAVHFDHGFFMNWMGNKGGEGFEYHLVVLAIAIPLIVTGGGLWSIDRAIALRREHTHV